MTQFSQHMEDNVDSVGNIDNIDNVGNVHNHDHIFVKYQTINDSVSHSPIWFQEMLAHFVSW